MQSFIQKHKKKFVIVTLVLIGIAIFVYRDDIIAKILPNASELQLIYCELEQMRYEYTGENIEPEIIEVAFQNKEGNTLLKTKEEIHILSYINNIEHGAGSIEVTLDGYNGTAILNDVFYIHPEKTENLQMVQASSEFVELEWNEVTGASGYEIYRSIGEEGIFKLIHDTTSAVVTRYQDQNLELNQIYQYKVCAYFEKDNVRLDGAISEIVTYYTPLSTAVLTSVESKSYNTIELKWEKVEGAVGYQVFRTENADVNLDEFECIMEISDAEALNYVDSNCACGVEYFYYIKACQKIDKGNTYGEPSNVLSQKTVPDTVTLYGSTANENTQVTLKWSKSEGASGYEIYKSEGYGAEYKLAETIEDVNTLTWSESELSNEIEYSYKIRPYCLVKDNKITGEYSNIFLKEIIIIFDYKPEELTGNIAKITEFQGARYLWGGTSPEGWDCSGFTQWALKQCYGIDIPRVSSSQAVGGSAVSLADRSTWQAGDILAYTDGSQICHVALYIGNGQIMHALNEEFDTVVHDVDYYETWDSKTRLVAVRRYL